MNRSTKLLLSTLALLPLAVTTACAADTAGEAETLGKISMALEGTAESGVTYRLVDAVFVVSGTTSRVITPAAGASSVAVDLPGGDYEIELVDGWSFARVQEDGSLAPVEAQLVSSNPQPFSISDGTVTSVQFLFYADEPVVLGEGTLDLSIGIVDELPVTLLANFEDAQDGNEIPGSWNAGGANATRQYVTEAGAPEGSSFARVITPSTGESFFTFTPNELIALNQFSAISFWYRSNVALTVEIFTPETLPTNMNFGTCTGSCWDAFVSPPMNSTGNWTYVEIPFAHFAQQGWGTVAVSGLTEAYFIQFQQASGMSTYDVDYVALIP